RRASPRRTGCEPRLAGCGVARGAAGGGTPGARGPGCAWRAPPLRALAKERSAGDANGDRRLRSLSGARLGPDLAPGAARASVGEPQPGAQARVHLPRAWGDGRAARCCPSARRDLISGERNAVDLGCADEVVLRQPLYGVRRERDAAIVVSHLEIGVVILDVRNV